MCAGLYIHAVVVVVVVVVIVDLYSASRRASKALLVLYCVAKR